MDGPSGAAVVVVCPLEVERKAVARRVGDRCEVVRCGPGQWGVRDAVQRCADGGAGTLILAGLAGGLRDTDACPAVARVVDGHGRAWVPTFGIAGGVTLLGVERALLTTEAKRGAAASSRAELVDCESHAFAASASALGLRWGVARAVQDGPGESLPAQCERWVGEDGRTRIGRVLLDLAANPGLIPTVRAMGRRSAERLELCARRVEALVDEVASAPRAP